MKAAIISNTRTLQIVDVAPPEPAPGEVRIRVEGCGVCASNLPVWEGRPWFQYPLLAGEPGHEGWGVVDAITDGVDGVRPGSRVAFLSSRAYAEYDIARADSLVALPWGGAFPGEAVGCAMNIHRRADLRATQTVVVIGAGFLGNALIQLAKHDGARVIAVSRREWALDLARTCGADEIVKMDDAAASHLRELTNDAGAERVIECTGAQSGLDLATQSIAERGRLIVAGYHQDGARFIDMQRWNWLGIDVINAHERDPRAYVEGMREAVDAVQRGTIDLAPLLTHTYAIDELDRALDAVAGRPDGFVKGMIAFA